MKYQIIYLCLAVSCVLAIDLCKTTDTTKKGCKTCVDGAEKKNEKCVCKVGYEQIKDGGKSKCQKITCYANCKVCKSSSECLECEEGKSCTECLEGFEMDDQNICQKVDCKIENCKTCQNGTCKECQEGYFLNSNDECEQCPETCKTCTNMEECDNCIEGALENEGVCQCEDGFKVKQGKCQKIQCPEGCKECSSETECKTCIADSQWNDKKCQCKEGMFLENNKCESCSPLCQKCESLNKCTQCSENSDLKDGTCQCKEGFALKDRSCLPLTCLRGCKKCISSFECKECEFNRTLNQKKNCECGKEKESVDFTTNCIAKNSTVLENFNYNSQKTYDKDFDFCQKKTFDATQLDTNINLMTKDNVALPFKNTPKNILQNVFVSLTTLNKYDFPLLFTNFETKSQGRLKKELKDQYFNIVYNQGIFKNSTEKDRYVNFDIQNPESLYHFNLIINCGSSPKLNEQQVKDILDYYFGIFYICPPNCKDCQIKDDSVTCQKCIAQFEVLNGQCKYSKQEDQNCANSKESTSTCINITNEELLICQSNQQCQNCLDQSEIKNMDASCKKCLSGYYLDQRNLECKKCDKLCEECEYRKNYCSQCIGSAFLDQQTKNCLECNIDQCVKCDSAEVCQSCAIGYFKNNSKCSKCDIPNCDECSDSQKCTKAATSYYLNKNNERIKCSTSNCAKCDDKKCSDCLEGFWINDEDNCVPCNENCKKCKKNENNEVECEVCNDGFYENPFMWGKCIQCEVKNCKTCHIPHQCEACWDPMELKSQKCKCPSDNQFWDESKKKCTSCGENCKECDDKGKCKECEEGYYLDNAKKKCIKCLEDCKICTGAKTCSICDGKILSKDKDKCTCKEGCSQCKLETKQATEEEGKKVEDKLQEICSKAKDGYYLAEQIPTLCNESCKTCENQDSCSECKDGYFKDKENKCLNCPENCKDCNDLSTCNSCDVGSYLQDKQCKKCENCEECELVKSAIKCTKCAKSQYLKDNECIDGNCENELKDGKCDKCLKGYYLKDGKCEQCLQFCDECSIKNKQVICTNCQADYQLNDGQCGKKSNILQVIIILLILAGLYFLYKYRETILGFLSQKSNEKKYPGKFDPEVELPKQEMNLFNDY